jgi:D-alanine-D-alanine ligase
MENKKIRLGILFGGKSAEHEVSLISAKNIIAALDKTKYEVLLIGIDKKGQWHLRDESSYLIDADSPERIQLSGQLDSVALVPQENRKELVSYSGGQLKNALQLDVVFPVLHGTYGEDGTVQGLLKLANIAFVGAGVLGSAVGMDKDVMKRLLRDAQIPVAPFLTIYDHNKRKFAFDVVVKQLGLPFFVKPANLGSSVGISKVSTEQEYEPALLEAFQYDRKILLEEFVPGREMVCAVLGNDHPVAALPGEIVPHHEFYNYKAKYLNGATYHIPAQISADCAEKIQTMALEVYRALCCEGMARIDFFLRPCGSLVVNELNSIPGFTPTSTYPRMWEASGLSYSALIDRLIELALERHQHEGQLKTSF